MWVVSALQATPMYDLVSCSFFYNPYKHTNHPATGNIIYDIYIYILSKHNRKTINRGYTVTYFAMPGSRLHKMQLLVACTCPENTWSLLQKL